MDIAPAIKTKGIGARDMTQQLRVFVVLPDDLSSVSITHDGQLTIACNSRCRGSNVFS